MKKFIILQLFFLKEKRRKRSKNLAGLSLVRKRNYSLSASQTIKIVRNHAEVIRALSFIKARDIFSKCFFFDFTRFNSSQNLTELGVVPCILLAKSHGKPNLPLFYAAQVGKAKDFFIFLRAFSLNKEKRIKYYKNA